MKRIFGGRVTSTGSVTGKLATATKKVVTEAAEAMGKIWLPEWRHIRFDEDSSGSTMVQRDKLDAL